MTRNEILNMEAGKEMDVLVAERVMGWHIVSENGYLHWNDADNRFQCGVSIYDFEDAEDFHTLKWHPSESVLWVWNVVEKLIDRFLSVGRSGNSWVCVFDWDDKNGNQIHKSASADTAELAICRAALLTTLDE